MAQSLIDEEHLKGSRSPARWFRNRVEHAFDTETASVHERQARRPGARARTIRPDARGVARQKPARKSRISSKKRARKIERETLRRDDRASADARYLSALLYPHRHLQERFYSILPFLAEHGPDLIDRLYDAVQLDCPDHRVLTI